MTPEPRKLPVYSDEIVPGRWYCFHCEQHRNDQELVHLHVKNFHSKYYPENGEDYGDSTFTARKMRLRREWEEQAEQRFRRELDSLLGADDLAFEIGDGSGLPPYA